ncbi:MAG: ribonuclease III [Acidobacteria bacterium]|nr:ribonuclease III [Acidobacteriota bacterium]
MLAFLRRILRKKSPPSLFSISDSEHVFLDQERRDELRILEARLEYSFQRPVLLDRALTHKSFTHEDESIDPKAGAFPDYEALEFLGDSVLGLVISDYLVRNFPHRSEGEFSQIRSYLVSEAQLHQLSEELGLGKFMRLSYGEEKTGGRRKKAMLADLFESVAAAIYLDGGMEEAHRFVLRCFGSRLEKVSTEKIDFKDYKSALQEELHTRGLPEPDYRVVEERGPDHRKHFVIEVRVRGRSLARAVGGSKKEAQQRAAEIALQALNKVSEP